MKRTRSSIGVRCTLWLKRIEASSAQRIIGGRSDTTSTTMRRDSTRIGQSSICASPSTFNETSVNSMGMMRTIRPTWNSSRPTDDLSASGNWDEFADTGFPQQPHQVSLNLSAWFGRSGSMVCTREKSGVDGEESQVYVYGVVFGGSSASRSNVMNLFTEEMKPWFESALAFDPDWKEHPIDFDRRFLLG
ncbi:hypothetical protein PV04_08404 [Phialophora macrospora]|uniref:Uncharacterized protein n=1 Tax=Phialophora macrospora TaxID=1851006 RepID=A0A0D2G269_9EURO|nr:hypothetical protein PV04_08404 [Phialophora macrospora]